jgi:hypothetical protein
MTTPLLCESPKRRRPQEKCASKCVRGTCLSAFIYFLAQQQSGVESLESRVGSPNGRLETPDHAERKLG